MIRRGAHLRPHVSRTRAGDGAAGGTCIGTAANHKNELRRRLRDLRRALSPASRRAKSLRCCRHLLHFVRARGARRVAVYLAAGSEVDTAPLIRALHARRVAVSVPVILSTERRAMRMMELRADTPLRVRHHGIREPAPRWPARARPDLVVLPLLAYDRRGFRLGSGAGYYDRWLATLRPRPLCVGYAYGVQAVAHLPAEAWDQRLDGVCTERGLRRFWRR